MSVEFVYADSNLRMTVRELRPKNSSKTIVAIFLAATAALAPPFVRSLWLADSTEDFSYGLFAGVLYALALVLVLLIFLPIHFRSRDRFVVRWWMYAGIGLMKQSSGERLYSRNINTRLYHITIR